MKKTLFILSGLWLSISAMATDYYINGNASISGNGLSWSAAFRSLNDFNTFWITLQAGDRIFFADGDYENSTAPGYNLVSGVEYYGGYHYDMSNMTVVRDPHVYITRIKSNTMTFSTAIDISRNLANTTKMDGIYIKGSAYSIASIDNQGYFHPGEVIAPVFNNCVFEGGYAGVFLQRYSELVAPQFKNCRFENSVYGLKTSFGYNANGYFNSTQHSDLKPTFENCIFSGMENAVAIVHHDGGNYIPSFKKCTFRNNTDFAIRTFSYIGQNNYPSGNLHPNYGMQPTYEQCEFYHNNGVFFFEDMIPANHDFSHVFNNCSFYNNQGTNTYAFTGNSFANATGVNSIYLARFNNSIIWGNRTGTSEFMYLGNAIRFSFNHTLIEAATANDSDPAYNCINIDPTIAKIEVLNGTSNMLFNQDPLFTNPTAPGTSPDLHPQPNSPVIDAGDNSIINDNTDMDNLARKVGDIDLGPYEYCPGGPYGCPVVISTGPSGAGGPSLPLAESFTSSMGGNSLIYPNPAADYFTVKSETKDPVKYVEVTDINGNVVAGSRMTTVKISHLAKGTYLVNIHYQSRKLSERLIKR